MTASSIKTENDILEIRSCGACFGQGDLPETHSSPSQTAADVPQLVASPLSHLAHDLRCTVRQLLEDIPNSLTDKEVCDNERNIYCSPSYFINIHVNFKISSK